jgi:large subunit ribosomal protein L28
VWEANLQRIHAMLDGRPSRVYACTRCIRGGKIQKAVVRKKPLTAPAA